MGSELSNYTDHWLERNIDMEGEGEGEEHVGLGFAGNASLKGRMEEPLPQGGSSHSPQSQSHSMCVEERGRLR